MSKRPGVVTISLDTEFAWGCFDTVGVVAHERAYTRTREVVDRLCNLFAKYEIPATWALVAHLLDDCSATAQVHADMIDPQFEWVGDWKAALPCQTGVDRDLWYAPDVLETIQGCSTDQEIGLHGYSHMVLDENECNRDAAEREIESALSVAREAGLSPDSFVYPRNRVGYRSVLADNGIETYRSPDLQWYERARLPTAVRKGLRFATEFRMATPPVGAPRPIDGLVAVPGSQVFRPYHGGWQYTPDRSQVTRAKKGIDRAAETGEIFHLWFHPFNLALESDRLLTALEDVLTYAASERAAERIEVLPLGEIARQFRDGRWTAEGIDE
ncbi:hypothetical protein [Halorientalis halophila]|uniref:hypothetical protein n=1 Tax=Halorientalis halophila TaxID=3108499 RepID=UPI00300A2F0D